MVVLPGLCVRGGRGQRVHRRRCHVHGGGPGHGHHAGHHHFFGHASKLHPRRQVRAAHCEEDQPHHIMEDQPRCILRSHRSGSLHLDRTLEAELVLRVWCPLGRAPRLVLSSGERHLHIERAQGAGVRAVGILHLLQIDHDVVPSPHLHGHERGRPAHEVGNAEPCNIPRRGTGIAPADGALGRRAGGGEGEQDDRDRFR
mmetsp:Transcript_17057/g.36854  ORF Transcript_17057/g.36854 Transcript_17057/m.36854 type:complete len:200 (+) Transcript_17057:676-1275(+)